MKKLNTSLLPLMLLVLPFVSSNVLADVIWLPKGSGILWQGYPFSTSMTGIADTSSVTGYQAFPGIAIDINNSSVLHQCTPTHYNNTSQYNGRWGWQISPGVWLAPVATFSGDYVSYSNKPVMFNGQFGEKSSVSQTIPTQSYLNINENSYVYCSSFLLRNGASRDNAIKYKTSLSVNMNGYWEIFTDGTQKQQKVGKIAGYALVTAADVDQRKLIFPPELEIRISTLECNISTPTQIDFGNIRSQPSTDTYELAQRQKVINTTCTQGDEPIDANINIGFNGLSGFHGGYKTRLATSNKDVYITGELQNVDGRSFNGECGRNDGISFERDLIKLGRVNKADTGVSYTNPITWRLCRSASKLTEGELKAQAELVLTIN